jgi:antitoxin component of MazEF toxin-antitoxin module
MIQQKLRKVGNSYVVTIPRDEVARQRLREGQLVSVEIRPLEVRPELRPELHQVLEQNWSKDEPAYRYLAEH